MRRRFLTYRPLDRVAPAGKRERAALQKAILETEEARTRAAYLAQPDSEAEADDWSNAKKYCK